jgi:hypothetical protein
VGFFEHGIPLNFEPQRDLESDRQDQRTALLLTVITALLFAVVVLVAIQRLV